MNLRGISMRRRQAHQPADPVAAVRSSRAALTVGLIFVLAGGVVYRATSAYLNRAPDTLPLPPGTLNSLPMRIGPWIGKDTPLSESIIRVADVDDYVCRNYRHRVEGRSVALFVAYGVRARDLVPHRPEVCYPGNGWTQQRLEPCTIETDGGQVLTARLFQFAQGGLGASSVLVLNYYIVDGRTCPDVSLLRSKAWRGQATIRYMAQVQMTTTVSPLDTDASERTLREFARLAAPQIQRLLDEAVARQDKIAAAQRP